jgi:O-acetyl-ADP-ribose deacetylase
MAIFGRTTIEVFLGSITDVPAEAVVNPANTDLWMGAGVAGAIRAVGGEEIEREAMAQAPIEPGTAIATRAGRLPPPIRWVIHAATMSAADLETSASLVERATSSALELANRLGAHSVALPAMGTGVGGFPMSEAAHVMVAAAVRHAHQAPAGSRPERILFVVREDGAKLEFEEALREAGHG